MQESALDLAYAKYPAPAITGVMPGVARLPRINGLQMLCFVIVENTEIAYLVTVVDGDGAFSVVEHQT